MSAERPFVRGAIAFALIGLALTLFGSGLIAWDRLSSSTPYNPLGDYPVQRVVSDRSLDNGEPLVLLSRGSVRVEGTKCNLAPGPVEVEGRLFWHPLTPGGESILVGEGQAMREPGCHTRIFENQIPPEVRERTERLRGGSWEITGTEWPIAPDGSRGVPRTFRTETFTLSP